MDQELPDRSVDAGYEPAFLYAEHDHWGDRGSFTASPDDLAGLVDESGMLREDEAFASTPGYNALQRAIFQLNAGAAENPVGSNCQGYSRYFGAGCLPWCAFFISWCFDTSASGNRDKRLPWPLPGSTRSIYDWGRAQGRLVSSPRSGDIAVHADMSHSGIVRSVNATTGYFKTVCGNWSDRVQQVGRSVHGDNFSSRYYFVRITSGTM